MNAKLPPAVQQAVRVLARWAFVPCLLGGFVVVLVVGQFTDSATAKAAGMATAAVSLGAAVYWSFRAERWYWPYVGIAAVVHLVMVFVVPWSDDHRIAHHDPFSLYLVLDIATMLVAGYFASKLTKAPSAVSPMTYDRR